MYRPQNHIESNLYRVVNTSRWTLIECLAPLPFQQPGKRKCLRGLYVFTRKINKGLERSISSLSCRFSARPHKQTTCLKQANVKRGNVKHNSLLDSFSRSGPCLDGEQEYEPSGISLRSDTSCDSGWNFLPAIFLLLRLLLLWKNKQQNVGILFSPLITQA